MRRVGILGGGQLGLMLSESVRKLGGRALVYDKDPSAPALAAAERAFVGDWTDVNLLREFFSACDVVTYEFENVKTDGLSKLSESLLSKLYPSMSVLETTQHRAKEKLFLAKVDLPHAFFQVAESPADLKRASEDLAPPFVIKSCLGGYDGKGQWLVKNKESLPSVLEEASRLSGPFVLEDFLTLQTEASVIVARDEKSEVAFSVVDNVHTQHILDYSVCPSKLPTDLQESMQQMALKAAQALQVKGLLTVEFFVTQKSSPRSHGVKKGEFEVFINELAPRPHNSGHLTRVASTVSQFDALARVLMNIPLSKPRTHMGQHYCMVNLLGDVWTSKEGPTLHHWPSFSSVLEVMLYGKEDPAPKRKMGHFVTAASSAEEALREAQLFKESLKGVSRHDSK